MTAAPRRSAGDGEIDTARLRLRRWRDADRPAWHALHADPEVVRYLGPGAFDRRATDEMVDRFAAEWRTRGLGLWAVEVLEPLPAWPWAFIGFVGLHAAPDDVPFAPAVEVAWRLARPAWGHGYATEGARAALHHGFAEVGLEEIVSFTVPANRRSTAVMRRLGMRRDLSGDFDHPGLPPGHALRRHVLYRLPRSHWEAASPPSAEVRRERDAG